MGHSHRMNPDRYSGRYMPTSPLSPDVHANQQPLSPPPSRRRPGQHARKSPRTMHMTLPRFHLSNFVHHDRATTPSSTMQSAAITLNQMREPVMMESPRLMREKQREFLERAHLSATIAASSMGIKPCSPRLDPLGSPNGQVTPLALEEGNDYFQAAGTGPAGSPGPSVNPRNEASPAKDEPIMDKQVRQTHIYQ